jgi:hypothetical protein
LKTDPPPSSLRALGSCLTYPHEHPVSCLPSIRILKTGPVDRKIVDDVKEVHCSLPIVPRPGAWDAQVAAARDSHPNWGQLSSCTPRERCSQPKRCSHGTFSPSITTEDNNYTPTLNHSRVRWASTSRSDVYTDYGGSLNGAYKSSSSSQHGAMLLTTQLILARFRLIFTP